MNATKGSQIIYLYRLLKEQKEKDALRIAFTKENTNTTSTDADSTSTKDGSIRAAGKPEIEIETVSVLASDDEMIDKLKSAQLKGDIVEIWEVNLDKPMSDGDNKYAGTYYQGLVTSREVSSPSDDWTEVTTTFGINGSGVEAEQGITVPSAMLEEALYTFADTKKTNDSE